MPEVALTAPIINNAGCTKGITWVCIFFCVLLLFSIKVGITNALKHKKKRFVKAYVLSYASKEF